MIKICTLTIAYAGKDGDMYAMLEAGMKRAGVTMADIELKGSKYCNTTHFGNWCLTPVLNNEAAAKLAEAMGTRLHAEAALVEEADIAVLEIGQRVTVETQGVFVAKHAMEGKVIAKTENGVKILAKGSRTKGWIINPGDLATIKPQQKKGSNYESTTL